MAGKDAAGTLEFGQSSTIEGFASKAVSSDNDANPSVIVRELVQNSLDAARLAERDQVKVAFVFDEIKLADIPGIEAYKRAFEAAKKTHADSIQAAEGQVERITESLGQNRVPILQVLDNGIGLSPGSMNALLGDGLTDKAGVYALSAGSYGLGHFTAFPASDMQYILYGGVTKDGTRTMSAHAILAAHFVDGKDEICGKDGYYITGINPRDIRNRYRFPRGHEVPSAVSEALDRVRTQHGSGSVVTLLAFNDFRNSDNAPDEMVMEVAARHFFPAIRSGRLTVHTKRGGASQTLDEAKAKKLLELGKNERRVGTDTINGSKAHAIYRTLTYGEHKVMETTFGSIELHMRAAEPDENTRISLFRSGMFITDKQLPLNQPGVYSSYRSFNAVILIDPPAVDGDSAAFQLVRQAEGEKHENIRKQRLPKEKRADFEKLFREIRECIKGMATRDEGDSYRPEDFMLLDMNLEQTRPASARRSKSSKSKGGSKFVEVPENLDDIATPGGPPAPNPGPAPEPGPEPNPNPEPGPSPEPGPGPNPDPTPRLDRSGRRVPVRVAARRQGNRVRLMVHATEDIANAALRIILDQGTDASCTSPLPDRYLKIASDGGNGSVSEISLGSLADGQRHQVDVILKDSIPDGAVLKVDVVSRNPLK